MNHIPKRLNENRHELSETALKAIESSKKDIRAGRVYSSKKMAKEFEAGVLYKRTRK